MSEQVWYLYQNGQQAGPFDTEQVSQLYITNMIAKDGYIFKVGWKDWRPIEEGYEALGLKDNDSSKTKLSTEEFTKHLEKRRESAPRASIGGRVVVHNNGQLAIGHGVNISVNGIFVETQDQIFTVGETLKLSVRCDGITKAFNAEAQVIRHNGDKKFPVGYGLKFSKIDADTQSKIQELVNASNIRGDKSRFSQGS
jgi:hypothetical protein